MKLGATKIFFGGFQQAAIRAKSGDFSTHSACFSRSPMPVGRDSVESHIDLIVLLNVRVTRSSHGESRRSPARLLLYGKRRTAALGDVVRRTFSEPGSPSHLQLCPGSEKTLPSSRPRQLGISVIRANCPKGISNLRFEISNDGTQRRFRPRPKISHSANAIIRISHQK